MPIPISGVSWTSSASSGAATFLVLASDLPEKKLAEIEASLRKAAAGSAPAPRVVPVRIGAANDPFALKAQVGVKMLLNAHSTAIMAKLGKVVGNTMTNVSPSNLKLIGRATFLIQSHVNDALSRPGWVRAHGRRKPIIYGEANAVLFDSIAYHQGPAGHGRADGRGRPVDHQDPGIVEAEARPDERRGAGDPAEDRPQRLSQRPDEVMRSFV